MPKLEVIIVIRARPEAMSESSGPVLVGVSFKATFTSLIGYSPAKALAETLA